MKFDIYTADLPAVAVIERHAAIERDLHADDIHQQDDQPITSVAVLLQFLTWSTGRCRTYPAFIKDNSASCNDFRDHRIRNPCKSKTYTELRLQTRCRPIRDHAYKCRTWSRCPVRQRTGELTSANSRDCVIIISDAWRRFDVYWTPLSHADLCRHSSRVVQTIAIHFLSAVQWPQLRTCNLYKVRRYVWCAALCSAIIW